MKHLPINGTDVAEIAPIGRVIHVAGIIHTPRDKIRINWEIKGASGSSECEAWRGQYEIDCLSKAQYIIKSISKI